MILSHEKRIQRDRENNMPLSVEVMEKVLKNAYRSPVRQSHHSPKTVRGCISPNRLVSSISKSILHVQLQLVDFHGRQNINKRKYSFLKKNARLEHKQYNYRNLNFNNHHYFHERNILPTSIAFEVASDFRSFVGLAK